jgi:hypothetical protein
MKDLIKLKEMILEIENKYEEDYDIPETVYIEYQNATDTLFDTVGVMIEYKRRVPEYVIDFMACLAKDQRISPSSYTKIAKAIEEGFNE